MGSLSFFRNTMGYFFKQKGRPQNELEIIRKASNDPRFSDTQDPLVADRYCTSELADFLDLYASHPWVYVCASAIAQAAASVKFELKTDGKTVKPSEVGQYMVRPNPHQTWFDLMETTLLHLELAGNSYWEVIRGPEGDGRVDAIFPMRPDRMKIVPDEKKKIKRYEYQVDGNPPIKFEPQAILHLKYTSAKDEFYGTPPISSGQSEVTLDFWSTAWNKKFFKDGAEPGAVLQTDQVLTDTTWNRVRALWNKRHRGIDKAHEIAILEGGLKFQQVSSKHADMQYGEQKKLSRDTVLAIMRVPPVIVGLVDGITYANSKDQKKVFWQHNIIPKLQRIQDAVNAFLMPEKIEFNFVTKMIDSIVEDDEVKSRIAQSNVAHGIMTVNEVRSKYYDLPPVAWGDVYWAPMGLAPVDGPEAPVLPGQEHQTGEGITDEMSSGQKDPSQVPVVGKPKQKPAEEDKETKKLELEDIKKADPDWGDPTAVSDYRAWEIWKASAGPEDRHLRAKLAAWFHEQGERVLSKVERKWEVRKADGDRGSFQDLLLDLAEDNGRLSAILLPEASRIVRKFGASMLADLRSPERFEIDNPHVKEFLNEYAASRVRQINEVTRDLLNNALNKAYENREGVKEVLARIRDVFDGNISAHRAERIARTEVVTLTNTGRHEAARQSGVVQKKRWISEQLASTRQEPGGANHMLMHGKVVDFDKKFEAPNRSGGADLMDCPGDIAASAENAVGCLCIAGYFSGTEGFRETIIGKDSKPLAKLEAVEPSPPAAPTIEYHHHTHVHPPQQAPVAPPVVNLENKIEVHPTPPTPVNVENKIDVQPTPVTVENKVDVKNDVHPVASPVTVENKIDVQPTPVNVENKIDVQPTQVTVNPTPVEIKNDVVVQPAQVTVTPEIHVTAKLAPHEEKITLTRDEKGNLTSAKKTTVERKE